MIKEYRIKLNGKVYEVELESITEKEASQASFGQSKFPVVESKDSVAVVKAPLQGIILQICVNKGDKVKKGDKLIVIEAMKMENEVLAAGDGNVGEILVFKGQSVNLNDGLVELN